MSFRNIFVLCLLLGETESKVITNTNFRQCSQFFFKGLSPTYLNPSKDFVSICQQYNNEYFYATLYDTKNRIPVYSAMKMDLRSDNLGRLDDKFFIEPMLVNNVNHKQGNMVEFVPGEHANYGKRQALDTDYTNSGYSRGHLNPQLFNARDSYSKYATNTFTNIAPQYALFNKGTWQIMEDKLLKTVASECKFPGANIYVIVGVEPSTNKYIVKTIRDQPVKRVNVPKSYWTAICCDTSKATVIGDIERGWSFAYKASNKDAASVNVAFDPVDIFLRNQYIKLFADIKRENGPSITGCQFNKDTAIRIIQNIAKTAGPIAKFEANPTARFEQQQK